MSYTKEDLESFPKTHDFLIGIDSDGCVFDTMVTKQCDFFHPHIVRLWTLETVEKEYREIAEFVNLYSAWRGSNRFAALVKSFKMLHQREDLSSKPALPNIESLEAFIESGLPLGNPTLQNEVERTGDPDLARMLEWSLTVNEDISRNMKAIPPFPLVVPCLEKMKEQADLIVVSQTPEEALIHEWDKHDLHRYVTLIAGQELGSKAEHLQTASAGRYPSDHILKVGDAPGDLKAAETAGACFFPILPGDEANSWKRLYQEGLDRFFTGSFRGEYENRLKQEFQSRLPETPPWPTR